MKSIQEVTMIEMQLGSQFEVGQFVLKRKNMRTNADQN